MLNYVKWRWMIFLGGKSGYFAGLIKIRCFAQKTYSLNCWPELKLNSYSRDAKSGH